MTIAPTAAAQTRHDLGIRLDLAWTVSSRALGSGETYASAVLHVEAEWVAPQGRTTESEPLHLLCRVIAGARSTSVPLPMPQSVAIEARGAWVHVTVHAGKDALLRASFEQGRLVYCTGSLPLHAGLRGGAYDAPTGTLDLTRATGAHHAPGSGPG